MIGTGAGGAPVLARLAAAGLRVVALEAGPCWDPARDFATDEREQGKLFWRHERLTGGGNPLAFGANNSGTGRRRVDAALDGLHAPPAPRRLHHPDRVRPGTGLARRVRRAGAVHHRGRAVRRRERPEPLPVGRPPEQAVPAAAAAAERGGPAHGQGVRRDRHAVGPGGERGPVGQLLPAGVRVAAGVYEPRVLPGRVQHRGQDEHGRDVPAAGRRPRGGGAGRLLRRRDPDAGRAGDRRRLPPGRAGAPPAVQDVVPLRGRRRVAAAAAAERHRQRLRAGRAEPDGPRRPAAVGDVRPGRGGRTRASPAG